MRFEQLCHAMYDRAICTADIGAKFGDVRPLDEARIRKLSINGGQMLDRFVADSVFLTELANAGCITWSQREHLNNIIQPRERNEKLTEFLTRRSVADFQKFINVLTKEVAHLMCLFLTDGGEYIAAKPHCTGWFRRVSRPTSSLRIFIKLANYQYFF